MNGVMPNPQYMPSPHGLAKRIRLHHSTDFYLDDSQDNDQLDSFNEDINKELFKTSHIYSGDSKFTNQCLNFDLASSDESRFNSASTFPNEDRQKVTENTDAGVKPKDVTNGYESGTFKRIGDDISIKSGKLSEAHPQTDTRTESVESSFDTDNCSLVGAKSWTIDVTLKKLEPECEDLKGSHCKTPDFTSVKHEPKVNFGEEAIESSSSDFVRRSSSKITNDTSMKHGLESSIELAVSDTVSSPDVVPRLYRPNVSSAKPELNNDVELNYGDSTSDLVSRFQCKRQLKEKSTEVVHEPHKLKDNPNILRPSVIVPNKLLNFKPCFREDGIKELGDKIRQCVKSYKSEDNLRHENSVFRRKGSNFNYGTCENVKTEKSILKTKNMLVKNLNPYGRSPGQTYAKIVKRLPDYKQFSNVFQKAAWNMKHKNCFQISSSVDTTQSKIFNNVINTHKSKAIHDKNTLKKWQLNVIEDMEELEDFLDYVSGKISELSLAIRSIRKDIQLLDVESEDISVPLHYIKNTHFFDGNNLITSTRSEMLELGGYLLKKILSVRQKCEDISKAYRRNLVMVSRSLYKLCSIPIETKIIEERETVFGFFDEIEKLIETIEVSEQALEEQRNSNFAELNELQTPLKKFQKLDSLLDELC
ncbi:hypothetical protein JTE90_002144 [Oedothorax gibbosus]|uniref:Uncharacterized protein n=1 Tax=Oedothorax gibbosus TaxID=931172 RepID=A0AAV6V8N1_9ARAC|nr:hypothetical protein JTE90_002144 [Oedothorax gibbosus]